MVYMLPTFGLALAWVYFQAGRSAKVFAMIGFLALPAASVWIASDLLGEKNTSIRFYRETSDQTLDSLQTHGFRALYDTYDQQGFFGAGLGTATPGSHNLKVERPQIWQESAPSRILVELGVPGAIGFLGVMIAIVAALWGLLRKLMRSRAPQGHYVAGLVAFFIANVGSLAVSGQILADPFIAAFLGLLVGVALSFARPRLLGQATKAKPAQSTEADYAPIPAESTG
jgi:O-antigen ligase